MQLISQEMRLSGTLTTIRFTTRTWPDLCTLACVLLATGTVRTVHTISRTSSWRRCRTTQRSNGTWITFHELIHLSTRLRLNWLGQQTTVVLEYIAEHFVDGHFAICPRVAFRAAALTDRSTFRSTDVMNSLGRLITGQIAVSWAVRSLRIVIRSFQWPLVQELTNSNELPELFYLNLHKMSTYEPSSAAVVSVCAIGSHRSCSVDIAKHDTNALSALGSADHQNLSTYSPADWLRRCLVLLRSTVFLSVK